MKNFIIGIFLFIAILGTMVYFSPRYVVKAYKEESFLMEREFLEFRNSIAQSRFQEEIMEANNATLVSSNWSRADLILERPLQPDRYWAFNGVLNAKVAIKHPSMGQIVVDLNQKICVAKDEITIFAELNKPLDVGVTDLKQKISIKPEGQKTRVFLNIEIELSLPIPNPLKTYVNTKLEDEATHSLEDLKLALKNVPVIRGIVIPIR